jgi:hypothetical protein
VSWPRIRSSNFWLVRSAGASKGLQNLHADYGSQHCRKRQIHSGTVMQLLLTCGSARSRHHVRPRWYQVYDELACADENADACANPPEAEASAEASASALSFTISTPRLKSKTL